MSVQTLPKSSPKHLSPLLIISQEYFLLVLFACIRKGFPLCCSILSRTPENRFVNMVLVPSMCHTNMLQTQCQKMYNLKAHLACFVLDVSKLIEYWRKKRAFITPCKMFLNSSKVSFWGFSSYQEHTEFVVDVNVSSVLAEIFLNICIGCTYFFIFFCPDGLI